MGLLTYILIAFFLLSCGKQVADKSKNDIEPEETRDAVYEALILPINSRISKNIHGDVLVSKFGDNFEVRVHVKNAPNLLMKQSLRIGTSCPKPEDDNNKDGYVDTQEADLNIGKIIIPLDKDLSSQEMGEDSAMLGNYSYSESTSYQLMVGDLMQDDPNPYDDVVKLNGSVLSLERKVVTITDERNYLVACGILVQTSDTPTNEDDDWGTPRPPRRNPSPEPHRPPPENPYERKPPPAPTRDWSDDVIEGWERIRDRVRDWWYSHTRHG